MHICSALPLYVTLANIGAHAVADCTAKERRAAGSSRFGVVESPRFGAVEIVLFWCCRARPVLVLLKSSRFGVVEIVPFWRCRDRPLFVLTRSSSFVVAEVVLFWCC